MAPVRRPWEARVATRAMRDDMALWRGACGKPRPVSSALESKDERSQLEAALEGRRRARVRPTALASVSRRAGGCGARPRRGGGGAEGEGWSGGGEGEQGRGRRRRGQRRGVGEGEAARAPVGSAGSPRSEQSCRAVDRAPPHCRASAAASGVLCAPFACVPVSPRSLTSLPSPGAWARDPTRLPRSGVRLLRQPLRAAARFCVLAFFLYGRREAVCSPRASGDLRVDLERSQAGERGRVKEGRARSVRGEAGRGVSVSIRAGRPGGRAWCTSVDRCAGLDCGRC